MKTSKRPGADARASRRRFTKAAAAAFVAAPLAAALSRAQTPPATREAPAPPNPQPSPTPGAPSPPSPTAQAYAEVARLRFGDKLTPEEMQRVTRDLEGNLRNADRLRASKLRNADEPDFVFLAVSD